MRASSALFAGTSLSVAPFDFSRPDAFITGAFSHQPVCYVDGTWRAASGGAATLTVEDPCTNEVIGAIPNCGSAETHEAIAAAQAGFEVWRQVMPNARARILRRWADLMLTHKQALGNILSRESGKVVAEGVGEIAYAEQFIEWYAGEAERTYGDIIPGPRPDVQTTVIKQPVGVVGIITPWNFPAAMITRAAAGAMAAGCSVVLKPSELTPFSALALAQLAHEAGVPPGVFNVVTGDAKPIGDALIESFDVRKISFTGSTRVGKALYRGSADTVKKIALELGGNAPFLVFADADLERAADGLIAGKFRNAGQTCICVNRALVERSVLDRFTKLVVARTKALKVGNNFHPSTTTGSMINAAAVARMEAVVADAVTHGARVECGGSKPAGLFRGYFYEPTVLSHVDHAACRCCQEEIFGPVLPLVPFADEAEAIQLANSTRAGLASYVYTTDYRKQHRVSEALRFGMVGINDTGLSAPCAPFGGVKESGLGRDGSKYGIEPFQDIKYVLHSKK